MASLRRPVVEALRHVGGRALLRRRRPPPGARPGALRIDPEAAPPVIHVIAYDAHHVEEREVRDPESLALRESGVTWIDVVGFGDELLLERLRDRLEIHPLAFADVVNVGQRPKSEAHGDHTLVVTRMARLTERGAVDLEQVSIVLGPGWVVTFQEHAGDVFEPLRDRLRRNGGIVRRMGPDYLAYVLVDAVIDAYFPVTDHLGEVVEELEEEVLERPTPAVLARVHGLRRLFLELQRVQRAQREALGELLRDEESSIGESVRPYLRDAHDHATEVLEATESYGETASGLLDLYLSSTSQRTNEVVRTLTVIASIFIPLTFVAGVYGMNFQHMPELGWRFGYPAALVAMAAVAVGLVLWFRRRGWFGSDRGSSGPS